MNEREATEYFLQLYPKCGLKTVAVFGLDITPYLKHGFRDVQYEPTIGEFDCAVGIDNDVLIKCVKNNGIIITPDELSGHCIIQIHSGPLNAYKLKL